jgi:hypothetical protein
MRRQASCSCGQLHLSCEGEPVRVSLCHCHACQRRTGSAFGVQARFPREQVRIEGRSTAFVRVGDSGNPITFHFCPHCGTTVYWELKQLPDFVAVAFGAFADNKFPAPKISVYEDFAHAWVVPAMNGMEHRS